ncbi:MAG TPA: hypothetical protein VKE97_07165, partial [Acidimicrobiia bacterium]|nr:hypothetical protein [Acidimicrobiia bacterium]
VRTRPGFRRAGRISAPSWLVLRRHLHSGFDGGTSKLMKILRDVRVRALFWLVIILIYQAMDLPARKRRLRSRLYD